MHALLVPALLVVALAHHDENAPSAQTPRFHTSRTSSIDLPLPGEEDAFTFAVYGDRTGGPPEGIRVLAQAVADTNLFAPDLVMTVGDLVQGYNDTPKWLEQAQEYKATMAKLACPWFPVAGNHDLYWRGKGERPKGEHEADFEATFGPLWYAFEHKKSWFLVLDSDEGDPATGKKTFDEPACQRMSDAQLAWLNGALARAKGAQHVFVFLHHPRWLGGGYGDDWERVHRVLASAGNVSAVFAGHIHHMRYDGARDGIEYFALATVGGDQVGYAATAGYLHQFELVTVRKDRISVASVPVGGVQDPRAITGAISEDVAKLARALPARVEGVVDGARAAIALAFANPTTRPVEIELEDESDRAAWGIRPDHVHATIAPGATRTIELVVAATPGASASPDAAKHAPALSIGADYLADGMRVPLKRRTLPVVLDLASGTKLEPASGGEVAELDGDACLRARVELPDGPFTLEGWIRPVDRFEKREGFLCKTENSDYGLFVDEGRASFSVFLGEKYARIEAPKRSLKLDRWTHVAGVFDGKEIALYVGGERVAGAPASGKRRTNALRLAIGADVKADGSNESFFRGAIDEVRVSRVARYSGETIDAKKRFEVDADTELLLHLDGSSALWSPDASEHANHATCVGEVRWGKR